MTSGFAAGYKMESSESRALRTINSESYDYRDQAKLLTKLTSDVSYMAQYMRQMQKGIDDANANFIEQIGDFVNEILVVIGGGGNTGFDFGDLKYIFQAIGALFGFDQQTGIGAIFPINLFNAAWHFFSTYVLPLNNFGDAVDNFIDSSLATILDVLGEIPVVGQAAQILATWISDLRDGVTNIGTSINNTIENLGDLISDLWENPAAVISSIGQNMVTGLNTALTNLQNFIQNVVDKVIGGLTGIPVIGGLIQNIVNGFESLFDNLFRQPTPKNTLASAAVPALDAAKITTGQLGTPIIPNLDAGKITTGSFADARIPSLDGSKIGTGSVAAARIAALDAGKITTGSFGSAFITDGAVSNNKLGTDISGDKIVAGTVVAGRIGNLDGSKITTGQIGTAIVPDLDAGKITSGAFGTARFADGAVSNVKLGTDISGDKIVAGTVVAGRIGAIDASKVTTGNFAQSRVTNLVENFNVIRAKTRNAENLASGSDFDDATNPWNTIAGYFELDTTQYYSGTKSLKVTAGAVSNNTIVYGDGFGNPQYFEAKPGEQFYVELWARRSADWSAPDTSGPRFRLTRGNGPITGGTWGQIIFTAAALPQADTWTKLTGTFTMVNEAGVNSMMLMFTGPLSTGTGTLWVDDITVRRVASTGLIGDSAISNIKLGSDISGDKIVAGTVTAARVGALDASKISTGTFVDALIPNLAAGKITTGTFVPGLIPDLAAGKITTGTFSGSLIPALDSSKITTGNFDQTRVNNLTTDLNARLRSSIFNARSRAIHNLITSPGFDDTNVTRLGYHTGTWTTTGYSTEQVRSGIYSWKWTAPSPTAAWAGLRLTPNETDYQFDVIAGNKFYAELWVYVPTASGTAGSLSLGSHYFTDATYVTGENTSASLSTIAKDQWVKISKYFTIPANINKVAFWMLSDPNVTPGVSFYIDDIIIREVTDSVEIKQSVFGSNTVLANILSSVVPSLDASKIGSGALADARIPNLATSKITSGTFGSGFITDGAISNVKLGTDISGDKIVAGTVTAARVGALDASKISTGTFVDALIPNLAAGKITTGTFLDALIPNLNASKISAGTFLGSLIPALDSSKITTGTFSSSFIADGAIGNVKLGTDISGDKIVAGTVTAARVGALDASKISTGTFVDSLIPALAAGKITTGTFLDTLIPNLNASKINAGTFLGSLIPALDSSKITSGTFGSSFIADGAIGNVKLGTDISGDKIVAGTVTAARVGALDASKISTGTFVDSLIPALAAGKITTGTFLSALIPNLDGSKITTGTFGEARVPTLGRRKLRNVDFSNLLEDTGFENDSSGIASPPGGYVIQTIADPPVGGTKVLQLASTGSIVDVNLEPYGIPVAPGETYYIEYHIRKLTTGVTGNTGVGTSMGLNGTTWVSYPSVHVLMSALTQNVWAKVSGIVTVPAGANFMAVRATIRSDVPAGETVQLDNIVCRKATPGDLITSVINSTYVPTLDASKITTGTFGNALIASGLDAAKLTTGTLPIARIGTGAVTNTYLGTDIDGSKIGAGSVAAARISSLDASKISTGTFGTGLIPSLDAGKVTTGTFSGGLIPSLDASKITTGNFAQSRINGFITNLATKNNIVSNPGFENTTFFLGNATYSTDVARSGTYSAKFVGDNGGRWAYLLTTDTTIYRMAANPGDVIYIECWVYGAAGNTSTTGGIYLYVQGYDGAGTNVENLPASFIICNPSLSGVWTKISGYRTLANANIRSVVIGIYNANIPPGDVYYVDDPVVRVVTDANVINKSIFNNNTPLSNILSSIVPSLDASKIGTGVFGTGLIPSLAADKITTGTFLDTLIPSLNASKINAGTFLGSLIPGLDVSKIISGTFSDTFIPTLDAAKIGTGTFGSTRITDGAISNIKLGTDISGDKIVAGTVTAARVGSLDASKISTGTLGTGLIPNLDAAKITTGSFLRSLIGIQDFENLAAGSDFEGNHPWTLATSHSIDTTTAKFGTKSLKISGNPSTKFSTLNGVFNVTEGDQLYIEFWAKKDAAWNAVSVTNSRLRMGGMPGNIGLYSIYFAASDFPEVDTWKKFSAAVLIPAGCTSVEFFLYSDATAGNVWIDNIIIRRIKTSDVIAAGAISNAKLGTDISGDKIVAGTVTAARVGALDASKISSGTFVDSLIPALAAGKITTGTFLDALIPSLNASKINAGTFVDARIPGLDGSKITGGTVAEARVENLTTTKNTANRLSTVTSGKLVAQTNLCADPDCSRSTAWNTSGTAATIAVSTEQFRSSPSSLKMTVLTTGYPGVNVIQDGVTNNFAGGIKVDCDEGDVFYAEAWVRANAANTNNKGMFFQFVTHDTMTGGADYAAGTAFNGIQVIPNSTSWQKISMIGTVPAGRNQISIIVFAANNGTVGESYYVDDIVVREVTATNKINKTLFNSDNPLAAILAAVVPGLDGSKITGGTVDAARIAALDAAKITTGTFPDGRIPALAADKITTGTFLDARIPTLDAAKIGTGAFVDARIPGLDGSKITGGTVAEARIANLSAGKITSGTFLDTLIPALAASKITTGTFLDALIPGLDGSKITGGTVNESRIPTLAQSKITSLTTDLGNRVDYFTYLNYIAGGDNIVTNPGFEDTSGYIWAGVYDTTIKRSGNRSAKINANGTGQYISLSSSKTGSLFQLGTANEKFYVEMWVYGDPANTYTGTANSIYFGLWCYDASNTFKTNVVLVTNPNVVGTGSWVKISGILTIPNDSTIVRIWPLILVNTNVPSGNAYYFDDVVIKEVTETVDLNRALYNTDSPLAAILASVVPGLDGSKITGGTVDAARIASLDAAKITSGSFADSRIPNLSASKITSGSFGSGFITDGAISNIKLGTDIDGAKIAVGSVNAARIAALDAAKITSGTFGTALIADGAISNLKLGTDISGDKISVGTILAARIGALDAAKITSGTLAAALIGNGTIDSTKLATAVNTLISTAQSTADATNDNIAQSLGNDATLAGAADALATLIKTFNDLAANTKAIQELQSTRAAATTGGGKWNVDFSDFATVTAAGFSVTYSGSGASTIVISNGVAQWNILDSLSRDAKLVYGTDTITDFQSVRGTMSSPPQSPSGSTPYFYAIARVSPDGLYYVWARAYAVSFGNYKADIGYCLNGVETTWASNISLTWSLDMRFVAGVGTNAREYQIWSGNSIVYTFTESTIVSRLCSNSAHTTPSQHDTSCTKYRRWGAIAQVRNQRTGGKVEYCTASDNGTPSVNGSVARMTRTSTTVVNYVGGNATTALNGSFFDNIPHESLDVDANAVNGTFKVTNAKPYIITARIHLSTGVGATGTLYLQRSTNGGSTWSTVQYGNTFTHNNGEPLCGTWIQYLNADEMVRLAYNRGGLTVNALTGDGNGIGTYFAIASAEGVV